jgi:hypothetical protein
MSATDDDEVLTLLADLGDVCVYLRRVAAVEQSRGCLGSFVASDHELRDIDIFARLQLLSLFPVRVTRL